MFGVSTLGCPGLTVPGVAALLRRHGVRHVELRCAPDEAVHIGADGRRLGRELTNEGLAVLTLATYVDLSAGASGFAEHLELAVSLGAPALRIMPGGSAVVGPPAETLARIASESEGSGVRLLVETHDAFLRGADLAALLTEADAGPRVGAVWDALHPWRAGEDPADTARHLLPWLGELQIKDAAAPDRLTPLVPGKGAVPLAEVLRLVPLSVPVVLEHEARWYADAAPIDDAVTGALRVLAAR